MELISVTAENLEKEHICCAISNNTDCQVAAKKAWLAERFADGLVFLKGNVRGKCFIEYIPAEKAWAPVEAEGYLYIDCLWVSGQWKGQGNADLLLDACVRDGVAKGKKGLVALSSRKKQAFLSDPGFLRHKGFLLADTAEPQYELLYLPFAPDAPAPRFRPQAKQPRVAESGFVLYYTHQCPYTAKYVPLIEAVAKAHGAPFCAVRYQTAEQAQNGPAPFTAYSLFYEGELVTHEIMSEAKFEKLLAAKGL